MNVCVHVYVPVSKYECPRVRISICVCDTSAHAGMPDDVVSSDEMVLGKLGPYIQKWRELSEHGDEDGKEDENKGGRGR